MHRSNSSCNNSSSYLYFFISIRNIETVSPFCFCFFSSSSCRLRSVRALRAAKCLTRVIIFFPLHIKNNYVCSLYSFLHFLKIFQIYRAISIYWIMSDDTIGPLWAVVHGIKFFLRRLRSTPSYDNNILLMLLMKRAISKHFCLLICPRLKIASSLNVTDIRSKEFRLKQ